MNMQKDGGIHILENPQDGQKNGERKTRKHGSNIGRNAKLCTPLHKKKIYTVNCPKGAEMNTIPKGGRYMPCEVFCWECGEQIKPVYGHQYKGRYCDHCAEEHQSRHKEIVAEYLACKNRIMFERAMRFMEKAGCNMTEYKKAAQAVKKHSSENVEQYKSTHEMITAIVLLKNGFDVYMNYKIGRYTIDVYLPEKKVCLEIDGALHKGKELEDSNRDAIIRQTLGEEWETVRIPTKHIEENPDKIPDAIEAVYQRKKKLRKQNGGFLPNSYSKREQAQYAKAMVYQRVRVK